MLLFCGINGSPEDRMVYTEANPRWGAWNRFGLPSKMQMDEKAIAYILNMAAHSREGSEDDDDLPEPVSFTSFIHAHTKEPEELISGMLRKNQKMMVAAPAKAEMSCLLTELVVAMAEGKEWLGFPCRQSRVLYVNTDMRNDECVRLFYKIYEALGIEPKYSENLGIWNLRGYAQPISELLPALVVRAKQRKYDVIIIDSMYRLLESNEQDAYGTTILCNCLDQLCEETGCAVIFDHGYTKNVCSSRMDERISGTGIWLRDPDVILDLCPMEPRKYLSGEETTWRLESVMRNYPDITPVELEFQYPLHKVCQK